MSFSVDNLWYFPYFAQKLDCGHSWVTAYQGSSNEYPRSVFQSKIMHTQMNPTFPYKEWNFPGILLHKFVKLFAMTNFYELFRDYKCHHNWSSAHIWRKVLTHFEFLTSGIMVTPGPEVIKLFSYSTQLSMNFFLLISIKMPTIVGILIFISRKNFMLNSAVQEESLNW